MPCSCRIGTATRNETTTATRLSTKVTPPSTTALAASTWPRRGVAANVVRIMPRRYSEVREQGADADQRHQPGDDADERALDHVVVRRLRADLALADDRVGAVALR